MKKTINLQFAAFLSILLFNTTLCAQKNKLSISAAINSVEAQLGDPEWDSWGYVKNNFNNYGDITNKSFSLSVIPKYFISNDILLRFELGVTKINLKYFHDSDPHSINPPYSHLIQNQSIEQNIYRFIPGIQWNFLKKKFIETYCGMTVCYLHYSDMKYRDHAEQRVLATGVLYGGYEGNTTFAGGFAVGIGAFAGFNIYLSKHFSTGAES